jgi:hypothetical protein
MASSKQKKPSVEDLLSQDVPQGPLRRGTGMHLSTEPAPPEITQTKLSKPEVKRVNRGYALREDLIKQCKRIALEEDRALYEVMEEALEQYLERKRSQAQKE